MKRMVAAAVLPIYSHPLQTKHTFMPKIEAADNVFWNRSMLRDLVEGPQALHAWVLPVFQGFFARRTITFDGGQESSYILVSRRSRHRLGCRYKRRGVDMQVFSRRWKK